MADSYDVAATQIDENKRAMLAAMAAGGTAAVQAHQRAQADIAAQQAAAVQGALAGAAQRNAPGNLLPQLEQTVADPYRRYQADLAANQAYGAAAAAARQAANESYFAQAKAAIPALRNASQIAAAERAAVAQRQAEKDARESGEQDNILDVLDKQLGVVDRRKLLNTEGNKFVNAAKDDFGYRRASMDGSQPSDARLRDLFDEQNGIPVGYSNSQRKGPSRGKIISSNEAALRVGIPLKTRDLIWNKSKSFQEGRQVMRSLLSQGKSWTEVTNLINSSKSFKTQPLAKKLLLEMYREAFGG